MALPQFSGMPEKKTDPQTPPPPPSHPVNIPAQSDSGHLPNASAPDDERHFKRVDKKAYGLALALLAASVTLLLNTPHPVDHPVGWVVLWAASTIFAFLSLITAVCIINCSICSHPRAQIAKVQKMATCISSVTFVLAVLFWLALHIPFPLFLSTMTSVILFSGLLIVPIYYLLR